MDGGDEGEGPGVLLGVVARLLRELVGRLAGELVC